MQRDYFRLDASVRPGARKSALLVLVLAASVLLCGQTIVGRMFHETKGIGWQTPADSMSLVAGRHANQFFPKRMKGAIVMAVETKAGTPTVLTEAVAKFSRNVSERVQRDIRVQSFDPIVIGYYLNDNLADSVRKQMQAELVTPDHHMTVIIIQPTKMEGQWNDANSFLEEFCTNPPPGFTLHITGMMAVVSGDGCYSSVHGKVDTRNMNFELLFRAEVITLPVALIIIAKLVKFYVKLLLLPLLTIIISFVVTSGMMLPWMDTVGIPADVPAAMGSVTLALCLDYGLFFLTRFSEQHTEGWSLQRNVDTILKCTGKTITISGSLVAISFFGSMILPQENLKGTGFVMGIACISCMVTSILLIPAVLLVAGRVLTGSIVRTPVDIDLQGFTGRQEMNESTETLPLQHKETSHWLRAMRLMDRSPVAAVGVVLIAMSPLLMSLPQLRITGDRFALMPMDMPAMNALRRVQQSFPVGILDPYAIVITAPADVESARLSREIEDGVATLGDHDVKGMVAQLGLSAEEVTDVVNTLKGISGGSQRVAGTPSPRPVNCSTLAALGAGVASGVHNVREATDAHVLTAALRAAKNTGCAASDIQSAVAASAQVLHTGQDKSVRGKSKANANRTSDAVKSEALKLGLSQTAATRLASRIELLTQGKPETDAHPGEVSQTTLAAAKAGYAIGNGKLHGKGDVEVLRNALEDFKGLDITMADAAQVMRAALAAIPRGIDKVDDAGKDVKAEGARQGLDGHAVAVAAGVLMAVGRREDNDEHDTGMPTHVVAGASADASTAAAHRTDIDKDVHRKLNIVLDIVGAVDRLAGKDHGTLLMPSGFAAMLDLCQRVKAVGSVASMLGPTWAFNQRIDWVAAVAMNLNASASHLYQPLLNSHVTGNRALLEVHTTFPSIGPGGADFVLDVRKALANWESAHPGYKAEISGGAAETADTRSKVLAAMWTYLGISVSLIMVVVLCTFRSVMVSLRLVFALFFTLAATYGMAVIVYQTSLLHGLFPWLAPFYGLTYEVVPMVTGVAIALGLDYDILLVTRIVEFREQGFTDRASIFRGATKAGGVISGAGLIMALAFTGLCFSDKLLMQQFGVLLVTSVLFDTFVVRTVLVPSLMLIAQDWNWWPRRMPPAYKTSLEGEGDGESEGLQYQLLLG